MKINFRRWARIPRGTGSLFDSFFQRSRGFVVSHMTFTIPPTKKEAKQSKISMGFTMVTFAIDIDCTLDISRKIPRGLFYFGSLWPFLTKLLLGTWLCIPSIGFEWPHIPTGIIDSTQKSAGAVTHLWTPKPIAKGRFWSPVKLWLENSFPFKVSVPFQGRTVKRRSV